MIDLLLHNLRTIGTHHCDGTVGEEAADEIERLRAEVAGLREDAERYRWLRDECPWTMVSGNGKSNLSIRVRAEFDLGDLVDMVDEFDAAIDAARKGTTPTRPPPSLSPRS